MSAASHYVYGATVCPNSEAHPPHGAPRHANGCPIVAPHTGVVNVGSCLACRAEMRTSKSPTMSGVSVKTRYGMKHKRIASLLRQQGFRCAACRTGLTRANAHLDHDHRSGAVRGFLCRGCNYAAGHAKDNPSVLRALADYLEDARARELVARVERARSA